MKQAGEIDVRARLNSTLRRLAGFSVAVAAGGWLSQHLRSPAVASWQSSELPIERIGRLSCRIGGSGPGSALLLHGLVATGDVFGRSPDALATDHRVAGPDLAGFGRSLDEESVAFESSDHLDALSEVVEHLDGPTPLAIGAHSMGSALALRLAATHPRRVQRVVCIGAPIWPSPEAARHAIGAMGPMARSLLIDEQIPAALCSFNCSHRTLSGWIAAAVAPRWPVPVARQASLHTWPAYRLTLTQQVIETPWIELLEQLDDQGVRIDLVWGSADRVGDTEFVESATARLDGVRIHRIEGADHTLVAAQPFLLPQLLAAEASATSS